MYTIGELADLAGVTRKTLRHYDKIGLLEPQTLSEAGYRLYREREVDLLQQILFSGRWTCHLLKFEKLCRHQPTW